MRFSLVPRQAQFYDLFTQAGENALEAAKLVERRFSSIAGETISQEEVTILSTRATT